MKSRTVTYTALSGIPLIEPGDDLCTVIADALQAAEVIPQPADTLVIAQKIVSKAEGRYVDLVKVIPSARALELAAATHKDARLIEVILSESTEVLRQHKDILIVAHRLGFVMANAGVDQSNVAPDGGDRVLLLPRDPDASCAALKAAFDRRFGVDVAVVINDSFGRAWRNGVVGVALGAAGIPALQNLIGAPDLFGRPMRVTEVAIADELAAAASLLMGQADEGIPVVHVRGLRWNAAPANAAALIRPKHMDLFR
jgi:coenzyme F420-0:L-glutamate ligase / coenzyme F420-1:gamma-L-glutamate ligase